MLTRSSARIARRARPPQKVEELFRQIADGDAFRSAPTVRALLVYLWEHQSESVSEYGIATEALGRAADFDPKVDSSVRVQVARLRAKLKEFYEGAGQSCPLRLTLPLGGHALNWEYKPPQQPAFAILQVIPKRYLWAAGATGFLLIAACAGMLLEIRRLKASMPAQASLPRFWQSFLIAGKPVAIVVPSPLYFFWPEHHVYVRDLQISEFPNWPSSPFLKETAAKWGPPELAQSYVGAMEMTAGIRLLQYLEKSGQQVRLIESRRFTAESFAAQNTIFLGMPRTAGYLNRMIEKTNFYIASVSPDVVRNRDPEPGEPQEYREIPYSVDRRIAPAIVALLPARPEQVRIMLLLGRNLTGISSMLVTLEGLKLLDDLWAKSGSPESWEMVIQAEIYRDTVLKITPISCRTIEETFWK